MFRYFTMLAAALAVLALPLAASQARTYQDGLKKVGEDKPLIVFCYGANFDKINLDMYNAFFKSRNPAISRVLSRETYVIVPVFQQPTDAQKREVEKVMGKRGLPGGIRSYPCFIVVDGKGNFRGAVQSGEELETPEKAAAALASLLDDFRKQEKLLSQAEHTKGENRAKIMREALSISRVRVPGHGMYDPSNNGMGEKLQLMSIEQANAHVRGIINQGNYTLIERQMILVAYAGHMRRNKASVQRLRAIYTEIRNIDPTSIYGAYAEGAIELWVAPFEKDQPSAAKDAKG